MEKQLYQDIVWLWLNLGKHLRKVAPNPEPHSDTRELIKSVIDNHHARFGGGRNPFNWLKELQNVANLWHHLSSEAPPSEDDAWRDLDTIERVARYLQLDPDFIENVAQVKQRIFFKDGVGPADVGVDKLKRLIADEVSLQLAESLAAFQIGVPPSLGDRGGLPKDDSSAANPYAPSFSAVGSSGSTAARGEIADRVREYVLDTYIEPARSELQQEVNVRAGDIDKALSFKYRRLPLICSALRSQKFLRAGHLQLIGETGPDSGASTTTTFSYRLLPRTF